MFPPPPAHLARHWRSAAARMLALLLTASPPCCSPSPTRPGPRPRARSPCPPPRWAGRPGTASPRRSTTTSSRQQVDALVSSGHAGRRLQVRQHRRGLVAGHPRRGRQHHRRHRRVARRHEGDRRLHPQQGPEGRHLHRRRQGRLRLLLPDRPARRPRQRQRGPLRPGLLQFSTVGLRLRQGRLVRRQTPRASTPETTYKAISDAIATGHRRPPAARWCCRSATGARRTRGTGRPAWRPMWRTSDDIIFYGETAVDEPTC